MLPTRAPGAVWNRPRAAGDFSRRASAQLGAARQVGAAARAGDRRGTRSERQRRAQQRRVQRMAAPLPTAHRARRARSAAPPGRCRRRRRYRSLRPARSARSACACAVHAAAPCAPRVTTTSFTPRRSAAAANASALVAGPQQLQILVADLQQVGARQHPVERVAPARQVGLDVEADVRVVGDERAPAFALDQRAQRRGDRLDDGGVRAEVQRAHARPARGQARPSSSGRRSLRRRTSRTARHARRGRPGRAWSARRCAAPPRCPRPRPRSARISRSPRKPRDTAAKKATGCPSRASPTAVLNGEPPTRASSVMPAAVSPAANTSINASPQTTNIGRFLGSNRAAMPRRPSMRESAAATALGISINTSP